MNCLVCRDIGYRNLGEVRGAGYTQLIPCVACSKQKKMQEEFKKRETASKMSGGKKREGDPRWF